MSFTPLHYGPGILVKSVFPKHFSLIIFVFVQAIIDFETLYNYLMHKHALHPLLHTYFGSNLAILAALFIFRPLYTYFVDELTFSKALISAIFGAYSHVFIDSIMHYDLKPFAPFSFENAAWHLIEVDHLHVVCFYCAAAGGAILLLRSFLARKN